MAYINAAQVKEVRKALKEKFGNKIKFSVCLREYMEVDVSIMASEEDFSYLWKGKSEDAYGYGYNHINHFHLDQYKDEHAKLFKEIIEIMKTAPAKAEGGRAWYDNSDSMTDYFDTAFYLSLNVGKWDKPYVQK